MSRDAAGTLPNSGSTSVSRRVRRGAAILAVLTAAMSAGCGGNGSAGSSLALCGDARVDAGEDCDDGNSRGGDGCAANCTAETAIAFPFTSVVNEGFYDEATLTGLLQWRVGGKTTARGSQSADGSGGFLPGDVPIALRPEDARFDPIDLVEPKRCGCMTAVARTQCPVLPAGRQESCDMGEACREDQAACGPNVCGSDDGRGNAAEGVVGCGESVDIPFATYRMANTEVAPHTFGVRCVAADGPQPRGTAAVVLTTSIHVVPGECGVDSGEAERGPDRIPCTGDDVVSSRFERSWLFTTATIAADVVVICIPPEPDCPTDLMEFRTGSPFRCADLEMRSAETREVELCTSWQSGGSFWCLHHLD